MTWRITWDDYDTTDFSGDLFEACAAAKTWHEHLATDAADNPDHQPITYSWQLHRPDRDHRELRLWADNRRTPLRIEVPQ